MNGRQLVVTATSLIGGAIGLFAPVGVVKWLLRTEPEDAGILTLFFLPVCNKLKVAIAGLSESREMVIEGMIGIAQGENPRSIEAKLQGYLH